MRGININKKSQKRIQLFVKIAITVAILVYLVNYVSFEEIVLGVKKANKVLLLTGFILSLVNIFFQFLRWKLSVNLFLGIDNNIQIVKSLFYGFSAGLVTPIRIGEYLGRKLALSSSNILKVTIATAIEKFTFMLIVILVGSLVAIFFLVYYNFLIYSILVALFLISFITFILYLVYGNIKSFNFIDKLVLRFSLLRTIKQELEYIRKIKDKKLLFMISLALGQYVIVITQYSVLAKAFEPNGKIILFLAAGCIIMLVKSLISFLSFADLGVRESTSVFLLNKFGYSNAVGFNSAIFLFLFNLLIPSIIGLFMLIKADVNND